MCVEEGQAQTLGCPGHFVDHFPYYIRTQLTGACFLKGVCVRVCACVRVRVCICACVRMYTYCVYVHMYLCISVCLYGCKPGKMYVRVHACMYECTRPLCMYVWMERGMEGWMDVCLPPSCSLLTGSTLTSTC